MSRVKVPRTEARHRTTPSWRSLDWSEHERTIEIEGRRLNYVDVGAGDEAVLFIHGLSGSWHWWLETLPAIAEHRRAIAIDLPGCGSSDMPAAPISLDLWCRQLDELCERLGLGPITVAGFSLGTVVAPALALRHPGRVEKLVLVGGPILSIGRLFRTPVAATRRHPRMAAVVASEVLSVPIPMPRPLARQIASRPGLRKLAFAPYIPHPERMAPDLILELLSGLGAPGVIPSVRACIAQDVDERLEQIECPLLAINGADDKLVPAADIDELVRRLPHAWTRVFEDTGHWPQLERPAAFNAEVANFLEES